MIAAVVVGVPLAEQAVAHISDPTIETVVDGVSPALPGVTIQVAESVTAELVVANTTATDVVVLGNHSEPFLRIGPAGVFANLASPTWYRTNSPTAVADIPADADTSAPPRWVQVSTAPSWGWFEHRIHPNPRALLEPLPDKTTTIKRWSVPLVYGDTNAIVRGRVLRRPLVGGYTARLRSIAPPVAGLSVQVSPGAVPALFIEYSGSTPVVVVGAAGESFARLSPAGVEVNRRSPTWIDNVRARDQDVSGLVADPAAPPEWTSIATAPTFAWLDPRGALERPTHGSGKGTTRTRRWRVPVDAPSGRSVIVVESGVSEGRSPRA